jgi:hypothetical protein
MPLKEWKSGGKRGGKRIQERKRNIKRHYGLPPLNPTNLE